MKGATVAVIVGAVVLAGGGVAYAVIRKKKQTGVDASRAIQGAKATAMGAIPPPPGRIDQVGTPAWKLAQTSKSVAAFVQPGGAASGAYQQQASGGGGLYNKAAAVTDMFYPGIGSSGKKVLNALDNLVGGKASSLAKKIPILGGLF